MRMAARDISFHPGAAEPMGPGFHRLMIVLQVAGALLAIPAGLASAWSIYHANFSIEARCQSLRGGIVSMLDKSADATTLRMLIGRDVKAFEQSCGSVDPDAVAAFKTLLAANKPAAVPAAAPAAASVAPAAPLATASVSKPAETEPVQHAGSDAKWLAAVREALVSHRAEAPPAKPVERTETTYLAPPLRVAPPVTAMPAPIAVASVTPVPVDHPVPPALIPEAEPAPPLQARDGYRLGALIGHVPLIRGMFGR